MPDAPSDEEMQRILQDLNRGGVLRKPFQVNWRDPPTSVYNVCVENFFSTDFSKSSEADFSNNSRLASAL